MDVTSDEARTRLLLDEMTSGQPDAPPYRYAGIVRLARRSRLTRAAVMIGVAAVVAVVAAGVGTSASLVRHPSGHRSLPGWALPWPDHRNGSVPQRVLDGAVTAWRRQIAAKTGLPFARTRPARVIWYVGQTVASWQAVAVIFEVDSDAGERLVTGWAATGQVLEGQPAWTGGSSPWVLFDVAAPWPTRGLAIGLNLHGTAIRPGPNPDSWVIVLAAPDVWTMRLSVRHSPAPATGKGAGFVLWPPRQGLLVRDVGQLGSRVKLILFLDNGRGQVPPHPAYVGVPGSRASQIPYLAAPVAIPARPGFRPVAGLTDQGSSRTSLVRPRGRLAILARCYGAGRLRVSYGSGAARVTLGTLKCDDYVHELTTNVRLSTPHTGFWFDASDLTAYRVMLGTVR